MKKSVFGWFSAAFVAAVMLSSHAAEPVEYLDWNEATKSFVSRTCTDYKVVESGTESFGSGWYVVKGSVERGQITVTGNAHLILCAGSELYVLPVRVPPTLAEA